MAQVTQQGSNIPLLDLAQQAFAQHRQDVEFHAPSDHGLRPQPRVLIEAALIVLN